MCVDVVLVQIMVNNIVSEITNGLIQSFVQNLEKYRKRSVLFQSHNASQSAGYIQWVCVINQAFSKVV